MARFNPAEHPREPYTKKFTDKRSGAGDNDLEGYIPDVQSERKHGAAAKAEQLAAMGDSAGAEWIVDALGAVRKRDLRMFRGRDGCPAAVWDGRGFYSVGFDRWGDPHMDDMFDADTLPDISDEKARAIASVPVGREHAAKAA